MLWKHCSWGHCLWLSLLGQFLLIILQITSRLQFTNLSNLFVISLTIKKQYRQFDVKSWVVLHYIKIIGGFYDLKILIKVWSYMLSGHSACNWKELYRQLHNIVFYFFVCVFKKKWKFSKFQIMTLIVAVTNSQTQLRSEMEQSGTWWRTQDMWTVAN